MVAVRNAWHNLLALVYRLPAWATRATLLVVGLCLSWPVGLALHMGYYDSTLSVCQPPNLLIGDCYTYARTATGWIISFAIVCVLFLAQMAASYLLMRSVEVADDTDSSQEDHRSHQFWYQFCGTVAATAGILLVATVILVQVHHVGMPDTSFYWNDYESRVRDSMWRFSNDLQYYQGGLPLSCQGDHMEPVTGICASP